MSAPAVPAQLCTTGERSTVTGSPAGKRNQNASGKYLRCKSGGLAHYAVQGLPLTVADISKATHEDDAYSRVLLAVKSHVYDSEDLTLGPFLSVIKELTADNGCLLYGHRVVIPTRQQRRLLYELHHTQESVKAMKSKAYERIWWPNLDEEIESLVQELNQGSINTPPPYILD